MSAEANREGVNNQGLRRSPRNQPQVEVDGEGGGAAPSSSAGQAGGAVPTSPINIASSVVIRGPWI